MGKHLARAAADIFVAAAVGVGRTVKFMSVGGLRQLQRIFFCKRADLLHVFCEILLIYVAQQRACGALVVARRQPFFRFDAAEFTCSAEHRGRLRVYLWQQLYQQRLKAPEICQNKPKLKIHIRQERFEHIAHLRRHFDGQLETVRLGYEFCHASDRAFAESQSLGIALHGADVDSVIALFVHGDHCAFAAHSVERCADNSAALVDRELKLYPLLLKPAHGLVNAVAEHLLVMSRGDIEIARRNEVLREQLFYSGHLSEK